MQFLKLWMNGSKQPLQKLKLLEKVSEGFTETLDSLKNVCLKFQISINAILEKSNIYNFGELKLGE
ncbi:hypothetical protein [Leptospira kirschneri]|uniref:Uncharacterized protein n=2 Tax=Leptospira kirschneri TaxID=29507 RepID=A0A0E2B6P3_9LEPT|nr:hypothetical protein [Leptospira kirschneri]EKO16527.1 hypothetical protein LEP1GSC081_2939 [Leptospira kirschneri str. H1]EKO63033.1 hypothetical protein LEP1GSC082_1560 [Leptospira kirschneri str. H2]EMK21632.1 hypothetical protein LEP1GSC008_1878 [Leptospira kirschneri serovar Bulgarica str. Nikolaevo]